MEKLKYLIPLFVISICTHTIAQEIFSSPDEIPISVKE